MTRSIFLCGLFCLITFACRPQEYHKMLDELYAHTVPTISPDSAAQLFQKDEVLILDTRSAKEFAVSHIENAQFIDYDSFSPNKFEQKDSSQTIIVYCSVGYRSERIGEELIAMGYKNVMNLYGGIFEWKNNDYPIVNTKQQETDTVHAFDWKWGIWLQKGIKVYD